MGHGSGDEERPRPGVGGQQKVARRQAGPEDRLPPEDRRFDFACRWVATGRFVRLVQFFPICRSHIAEGTTLHVFLLLRLPASPVAASVARHAVAGLAPFLDPGVAENAELLVSELVTNSVRHAGLPSEASIEFSVRASPEVLMVEVADAGQGFNGSLARPRVVAGSASASGWGLFLVDRIADRWGAVQVDGETRVWFELSPGAQASPNGARAAVAG